MVEKKLQALVFDVDGTLADTEKDGHLVAFNQAFADAGLDWHWSDELYGKLLKVTGGKERMNYYLDEFGGTRPDVDDLQQFIAGLHQAKTKHYVELLEKGGIPLRPGVESLINEARQQGVRLAIATTTTPENVTYLLKNTLGEESLDWFEVIAAGDAVEAKKPAPDIYTWALDKMQLSPDDVVALEDSDNGFRSARQAGIQSVIVTINDYTRDHVFENATIVLDQMGTESNPARQLQGQALNGTHLTVDQIRQWHEAG